MPAPPPGLGPDARLRAELAALLRGGHAHIDARTALDDIPPKQVNDRPKGFEHSLWQLLWHLHAAQRDVLHFVRDPDYEAAEWPDDYWPSEKHAGPKEWIETLMAFLVDLDAVVALVEDEHTDLFAELGHAPGYTLFRQALLVADHNAYHLGQVLDLRRALGLWEG